MRLIEDTLYVLALALKAFMAAALVTMVCMVFGNVVLRYLFNSGIVESEELSRLLFVWIVFAGAVVVHLERGHLGVTLLVASLPARLKVVAYVIGQLVVIGAISVMAAGAYRQTLIGLHTTSAVVGYPLAVVAGFAFVSAVLMVLISCTELAKVLFFEGVPFVDEEHAILTHRAEERTRNIGEGSS